jgi:ubiquinone/menaquinone biosynthesis C-methylase UbiE
LDAFKGSDDPVPEWIRRFEQAAALVRAGEDSFKHIGVEGSKFDGMQASNERFVAAMFSNVWQDMEDAIYFDESAEFLRTRLEMNGVSVSDLFGSKVVVDAGCGSGKFSAAIASFGAEKVIGLDIGQEGLAFAQRQAAKKTFGGRLDFRFGSAHEIPLADMSVDVVFSNGVIHLTDNYDKCVEEFSRILKPGGTLFLYVNGRFGLYELLFESLRRASIGIPYALFQHYLIASGFNSGRVYWMMCAFYGPYQWRAKKEVLDLLERNGFQNIRQLARGVAIDQIELVSRGLPFAELKYGEAQLKFLATAT